jgi:putative transposase
MFAAEIRRCHVQVMRSFRHRQWHLGEALESLVTKRRDKKAALKSLRKSLRGHRLGVPLPTASISHAPSSLASL